jgi:hypothetical protein
MSKSGLFKSALGVGTAGALALAAITPAAAAPVLSNTTALKSAATDQVTEVRWRRGWGGGALAAGIIGGLALGAIASSPYRYSYGYAPGYAYAPTYYGYGYPAYGGYVDGPPFSAYSYNYYNPTQCYIEGGYGRRMGC